jgi:hypothetical protein
MRARHVLTWCALIVAIAGEASAQKPTLTVWTATKGQDGHSWCAPCDLFWSHFYGDLEFQRAIRARYQVAYMEVKPNDLGARILGIGSVPAFVVRGRPAVFGYTSKADLLARLGCDQVPPAEMTRPITRTQPDCAAPGSTPPPATPGADLSPVLSELERQRADLDALTKAVAALAKVRAQPGPQGPAGPQGEPGAPGRDADAARLAALEKRLAALEAKGEIWIEIVDEDGNVLQPAKRYPLGSIVPIKQWVRERGDEQQ